MEHPYQPTQVVGSHSVVLTTTVFSAFLQNEAVLDLWFAITVNRWGVPDLMLEYVAPKQLETYGCVFSIVATDALVLEHQGISIHSADEIFITLDQFNTTILHL